MKRRILAFLLCLSLICGAAVPAMTARAAEMETTTATEAPTEPETTEAPTVPVVVPTEPETTEAPTEPETTKAPTEPETTEAPTEPETTEEPTEPEVTEEPTEPETTEEPTEPETTEPGEEDLETLEDAYGMYLALMACTTWDELVERMDAFDPALFDLLTEEQLDELYDHMDALEPNPLPPMVFGPDNDAPVESEVYYPSKNVSNVAGFRAPVKGLAGIKRMMPKFFAREAEEDNGLEIDKTATINPDGTYTITLEAYASGKEITTEVTSDKPADIVLVLDQSGSMKENMNQYRFDEITGDNRANGIMHGYRANGGDDSLFYKQEDDSYVSVSVNTVEYPIYAEITNYRNSSTGNGSTSLWSNRNNLYAKVNGDYVKVTLERTGRNQNRTYIYTLPDGTEIARSQGDTSTPDFGDYGNLYLPSVDASKTEYTYSYTDADGATQTLGTSVGQDQLFTDATLYRRVSSGSISRLSALTSAVQGFVDSVNTKAAGKDGILGTEDDVNHRVAIVGFASGSRYNYENTELLSIAGRNSGSVGVSYPNATNQDYVNVMQNANTPEGQSMLNAAVRALAASGATQADMGMDMASKILNANPVAEGEQRDRVVIMFTDGQPTSSNGFESSVANAAIGHANTIKGGGATVYSVGIFDGADATSAGSANGNTTEKSNWFMQSVSSNNGSVRNPSYYLSAADAGTLSSIFQQISDNITTGGSSSTLDETAVIKDIISNSFKLPDGADEGDITLKTYNYIGENQWDNGTAAVGVTPTVNGDNVSVTGFDFSENWCGTETVNGSTTYRGMKLEISFVVEAKPGFLGGNDVNTNSGAGVYENADAENPISTFPVPVVNVPIKSVDVTAADKNVYLLGDLTAEEIKAGATVKVGDIYLDLTDENYGLAEWQNAFVEITVTYLDADNKVVTDLEDLQADTTYSILVTVAPKIEGQTTDAKGPAAITVSDEAQGAINVFVPHVNFADTEAYYGAEAPADFTSNKTAEAWKHGETLDSTVTMSGEKPTLTYTYTPDETNIEDGIINTKDDFYVNVDVAIGAEDITDKVVFAHDACIPECGFDAANGEFMCHVKTCTLTITKAGGAAGEPYVFTILRNGKAYTAASITGNGSVTIYELPVGTYSFGENQDWSWRYNGTFDAPEKVLSAADPVASVTCTNRHNENVKWLNGFSSVVANIFGTK